MTRIFRIIIIVLCFATLFTLSSFHSEPKLKIGFLIHDLVTSRWQSEVENFSSKIIELGGEPITRNAFGDAETQIKQGKELIDDGVKVIAVVAQNGKALAELVDYANKAGATIIAYDRMILNCDLHYYISFNSVRVGELMANYALSLKPKGNYIILNGPSIDNNAALVKKGIMNKLTPSIKKGNIKILANEEMSSWNALSSIMFMEEFIASNKSRIDVIITAADDLAAGVLDVLRINNINTPILTGQNASADACRNIMQGTQTMTVYKDTKHLSSEAAMLSIKIAKGEKIETTATMNNGKIDVPSILFSPVMIDKSNLVKLLVPHHVTEADLH